MCRATHRLGGPYATRYGKGRVRGAACQPSGGAAPSSMPASSGAAQFSTPAARRRRRTSADGGDADFGDTGDAEIESTPAVGRQPQRRRRRLSTQARGGDSPAPSLGGGTVTTPVKPTKKAVYSPSVSPAVVADAAPAEASSKRELLLRKSAREVEWGAAEVLLSPSFSGSNSCPWSPILQACCMNPGSTGSLARWLDPLLPGLPPLC